MIQNVAAAPVHARPLPDTAEEDLLDPLWRLAGDMTDARLLIVAEQGLDLMCGLIRRGCLAVTVLRPGDKPDADDYDVVFVAQAAALPSSDAVIRLARRSLAPNGRLIVGVQAGPEAAALARRLKLNGFSALHATNSSGHTLLRTDPRRPS